MDFIDLVNSRHSVRAFKNKEVPDTLISKILDALRKAPSAGNLQSYEVVIVKSEEGRDALSVACHDKLCINESPVVLVFLADLMKSSSRYAERGRGLYAVQDATIACAYAQLMASEVGLGSVWIGSFDEERVKKVVNSLDLRPIALLPIGYPNENSYVTPRREVKEFVHKERFAKKS